MKNTEGDSVRIGGIARAIGLLIVAMVFLGPAASADESKLDPIDDWFNKTDRHERNVVIGESAFRTAVQERFQFPTSSGVHDIRPDPKLAETIGSWEVEERGEDDKVFPALDRRYAAIANYIGQALNRL